MLTGKNLFDGLKRGDVQAIETIYQTLLPKVKKMILNNSGRVDDAEDIFQETLEIILLKIDKLDSSFSGLVMRISKNRWIDKLRKKQRKNTIGLDDKLELKMDDGSEKLNEEYDKFLLMEKTFSQLGSICQQLMTLVKKGISTDIIVEQLSFNSANTMYRRKAACIQKWSSLIKDFKIKNSIAV